jgi:ABC-type iron transport system FetAB permease component
MEGKSMKNSEQTTSEILISTLKTLIAEVEEFKPADFIPTPGMIMGQAMIQGMEEFVEEQKKKGRYV